jgi:hypothetical protein
LIGSVVNLPFQDGVNDLAAPFRERATVGFRMVNRGLMGSSDEFTDTPSKHLRGRTPRG